jgi:uncharacterized protein YndB with AHSA1/START domain
MSQTPDNQTAVVHDTFTLERTLEAPAVRVFEAFSKPEVKARWFGGPGKWKEGQRVFDFKVGGREHVSGTHAGGMTHAFDAVYLDIVPGERIVYVYEMVVNGRKISASLATLEFFAEGTKTRFVLTEQGAFFADPDVHKYAPEGQAASRLHGTKLLMDRIAQLFAA